MLDQILKKDEFFAKLKEAGVSEENITNLWTDLEDSFYSFFMINVSKSLSAEQLEIALGGKKELSQEESRDMFEKVSQYVKDNYNSLDLDLTSIIVKSAQQAHDTMRERLAK